MNIITTTVPAVTFAPQSVVANYPDEKHEAIVMTPELKNWAAAVAPEFKSRWQQRVAVERTVLASVRGEAAWTAAGGHQAARNEFEAGKLLGLIEMLARGRVADGWNGWVTRHDWQQIVAVATSK